MTAIDTNFLIDLDNISSPRHEAAVSLFEEWRKTDKKLYVFSHIFLEYQHIITDPKRFERPLQMNEAIHRVSFWKKQARIKTLYSDCESFDLAQKWLEKYGLGRKRLIDTHMAAVYRTNGISTLWTANPKDFKIFDEFQLVDFS